MKGEPKYPFPLDTYIDEPHEVERDEVSIDAETGKITKQRVKRTQYVKTMYQEAPFKPFVCQTGKHFWEMVDRHKHLAKCKNCPKYRFLNAHHSTIRKGQIVRRKDGSVID